MNIIEKAQNAGRSTLSEYEAKQVLSAYGIPVTREHLVESEGDMLDAAETLGYPVVLKGCHADLVHKSEKGVIRVDLRNAAEAKSAYSDIRRTMPANGGGVLVQEMLSGSRELVAGMIRDPQFGPSVMFGIGGIFTEIFNDVVFRIAPIEKRDALEMMYEIRGRVILDAVRGMPPVDREQMADILVRIGNICIENPAISEIDINPLIICDGRPVAVDAMIGLKKPENREKII